MTIATATSRVLDLLRKKKAAKPISDTNKYAEELLPPAASHKPSEDELQARTKTLKQHGFQIALLHGLHGFSLLDVEKRILNDKYAAHQEAIVRSYARRLQQLAKRRGEIQTEIGTLIDAKTAYADERAAYKEKIKNLNSDLEDLRKKLAEVREAFAGVKEHAGGRLLREAEQEMQKALKLQREVQEQASRINQDAFNVVRPSLAAPVAAWNALRLKYVVQQEQILEKIEQLSGQGITSGVAHALISIGSAMAGVAGFFFSIFATSAEYSSTDALAFLLGKGIQALETKGVSIYEKIGFFISGLGLITLVSWVIYTWLQKIEAYSKARRGEDLKHSIEVHGKGDNYSYQVSSSGTSWLQLWLKALPLVLVVGLIILVISNNNDLESGIPKISTSTEGVLIGSTTAMGLAALVYLYLTKVIESRDERRPPKLLLLRNVELTVIMLLVLASIAAFAFYRAHPSTDAAISSSEAYSICAFIGSCFAAAFAFAYGLRFSGLRTAGAELEQQILELEDRILRYSTAFSPQLNLNLETYFKELGEALSNRLTDRNQSFVKDAVEPGVHLSKTGLNKLRQTLKYIREIIAGNSSAKAPESDADLFEISDWESKYFPEYAERISIIALLYADKNRELKQVESALLAVIEKDDAAKAKNQETISALRLELKELNKQESDLEGDQSTALMRSEQERMQSVVCLQEGFDLGRWYNRYPAWPPAFPLMVVKN